MDVVIKNGTIVTDSEKYRADIGIKDGKIMMIANHLGSADKVIDAKGKYVMPAGVDAHVHLQLPFCGDVSSDTFDTGTRAAAAGGITTLIDFAIQSKGDTLTDTIKARRAEADGVVNVDYSLHGGITDWNETTRAELPRLVKEEGITSYKMFLIYKSQGWIANDPMLFQGLDELKKIGGMIMVHAESNDMLDYLIEKAHTPELMKKYGAYLHVMTRPNYIEEEAIQRAIKWAEVAGGNLYVVHMSASGGADLVKAAKKRGVNVIAETCPQYLLLDDELFKREDGHLFGTCPQLKKPKDMERLWEGIKNGEVSTVATDTCTFDTKQKAMWEGDFTKIPFGMPGIETMLPLMYSEGVVKNKISLNKFVEVVSTNPARVFGLYPNKGSLQIETDADITIWDHQEKKSIRWEDMETNCDWSPFQDWAITGFPYMTLCRGEVVGREGKFVGKKGYGQFVKRGPSGNFK